MKGFWSRREFFKVGALSALAAPGVRSALARSGAAVRPIIVCSRGEDWGEKVLVPAWQVWLEKQNMLDAVEKAANVAELDPADESVGLGGYPNEDGVVELDACIMVGRGHRCGAVASLRNISRPSSVARRVMERSDHILLVGEGARRFALAHGFKEENLLTDTAREAWLRWKENLNPNDNWIPQQQEKTERPTGTINVLGIDDRGDVFGITTTSGLAFKIPGRVGDSPIIGAGLYLDNDVGAAGATGRGEEVIRTCGSFLTVMKMAQGMSPQQACEFACRRIIEVNGGKVTFNVRFIAVDKQGRVGCAQLRDSKGRNMVSYISADGFKALKGVGGLAS